ncbi:MAG TPA: VOC family protein [Terriglobia bacterium]|nr:VOC family protein [Terriglobia bacterium]
MTRRFLSIVAIFCLAAIPVVAQTRPFNAAGVTTGHQHLAGLDPAAHNAFWTALGAVPAQLGAGTQILKLPGVFIMFQNAGARGGRGGAAPAAGAPAAPPAAAPGPSEGSSVEYLAFKVKSLKDTLAKLEAAGTKPIAGATATQAFVLAPNSVKVQLVEDTALATPIASYEMLMKVSSVADASAWYEKWFGARVVKQGQSTVAEIPGMNIRFAETRDPVSGTQGRAINHIGLEVKNLEALMKKMTDGGVMVNRPYAAAPATIAPLKSLGFITDPWGTYIELNEGFSEIP